ncbi:hypothetical protein GGR57DRAFT_478516 [Xylariaceae sp. FL1272]|nr:hypothetical protein GGR57DRAFT_478516 [Xylariaceae sp. FL1272]
MSIVVLYEKIFHNIVPFRYLAYVMVVLLGIWGISFFFANLFICYPVTALIEPYYGNKCIDQASVFLSTLLTDLIFDILILSMPIPVVLRLHLPWRDRFGVLGMFLLGAIVVAVSIARLIQNLEVNAQYLNFGNDVTYYTTAVFFWTNIELSIAVIAACLPTLKPILSYFFPKAPTTIKSAQSTPSHYIQISESRQITHKSRQSNMSDNYPAYSANAYAGDRDKAPIELHSFEPV